MGARGRLRAAKEGWAWAVCRRREAHRGYAVALAYGASRRALDSRGSRGGVCLYIGS